MSDAQSESISFSRTQPNPVQLPKYYFRKIPKIPQPSTLSPQPSKGKEKKQVSGWRERAETQTTEEDPFFLAMIDKVNKDHENKMAFENFGKRKRNLNITDFECGNCEKCKRKK